MSVDSDGLEHVPLSDIPTTSAEKDPRLARERAQNDLPERPRRDSSTDRTLRSQSPGDAPVPIPQRPPPPSSYVHAVCTGYLFKKDNI